MIVRPTGQRLQRLRVARKTKSQNFSSPLNEMNPNKTKDFDLRQEDSVVYQRSRTTHRNNAQNTPAPLATNVGQSFGPGQDC